MAFTPTKFGLAGSLGVWSMVFIPPNLGLLTVFGVFKRSLSPFMLGVLPFLAELFLGLTLETGVFFGVTFFAEVALAGEAFLAEVDLDGVVLAGVVLAGEAFLADSALAGVTLDGVFLAGVAFFGVGLVTFPADTLEFLGLLAGVSNSSFSAPVMGVVIKAALLPLSLGVLNSLLIALRSGDFGDLPTGESGETKVSKGTLGVLMESKSN